MTTAKVPPQNVMEALGARLFVFRGWPTILFAIIVLLNFGPKWGSVWLNSLLGLAILALGEGIRFFSRRYIGRSSSTRRAKVSRLVTGGPFRMVRNPLYVGNLLIMVGLGGLGGMWWAVAAFFPLAFMTYFLVASYETRVVLAEYPEEGENYVKLVPAWIPRTPVKEIPPSDPVPWDEVWKREGKTVFYQGLAAAFLIGREAGLIPWA